MENITKNSCILDGITLQNAAYAICSHGDTYTERQKLLPIQLVCLAQLMEALVCYDHILTLPSHAEYWMNIAELRSAYENGIIKFIDFSEELINEIYVYSSQKVFEYVKSPTFQYFIDSVLDECLEGVILKVAKNYNKLNKHPFNHFLINDQKKELQNIIQQSDNLWMEDPSSRVAQVITSLSFGTFCYKDISTILQIPYSPFCLRAPISIYDDLRHTNPPIVSSQLAMSLIKGEVITEVNQGLSETFASFFDIEFPFVLAFALYESKTPKDLFQHTIDIRNSTGAREFRWNVAELEENLRIGNGPEIVRIAQIIKTQTKNVFNMHTMKTGAKVKLGIAGISFELPVSVPEKLASLLIKRKRNTFYYLLLSRLPSLYRIKEDIYRVFDVKFDLHEYAKMMSFTTDLKSSEIKDKGRP